MTKLGSGIETTSGGGPDALERALTPIVSAYGLEFLDSEQTGGTLRVVVEGSSLDLDRLAEVSAAVSALLDERPELAPSHRYELELTSPGVERRLRRAVHFTRALGQRVAVRTVATASGDRRAEGTLQSADEEGFSIELDDGSTRRVDYVDVDRVHTVFDWKAALADEKHARRAQDMKGAR